jgi:hypothetical protein
VSVIEVAALVLTIGAPGPVLLTVTVPIIPA